MNTTITPFHAGHPHLRRLLDVLARQLRAFGQGRVPDMTLMRDILDCLNRYTAVGSDAYERRMMDELTRADRNFAPARLVLTTEHDAIGELGRHCLALVEGIIGGSVFARSELVAPGQRYLRMYRTHLEREQAYLRRLRHKARRDPAESFSLMLLAEGPIRDFPDLHHDITRAMASWNIDPSGQPVCRACATDAAL